MGWPVCNGHIQQKPVFNRRRGEYLIQLPMIAVGQAGIRHTGQIGVVDDLHTVRHQMLA